jgi:glycine cleavage system transcriptional repressor
MTDNYVVTTVGRDRPGIVAAVSGVLAELGCNLQDSTMATLRGEFAIVLLLAAPPGVDQEALEAGLAKVADELDLVVSVRPLSPEEAEGTGQAGEEREAWTVAVHGGDRPGIVHAVTQALAEAGGNVVDLGTHLVGTPEAPVYTLTLRATVAPGRGEELAEAVRAAAEAVGVDCSVHRDDADLL